MSEYFSIANTILAVQLLTLGMVLHLWFDMMGHYRAGGKIASIVIVASLLVHLAPAIEVAYQRIRKGLKI